MTRTTRREFALKLFLTKSTIYTNESLKEIRFNIQAAKPSSHKAVISKGHDELICCVCVCALNILHGHAPISRRHNNHLLRHRNCLRKLVDQKISLKDTKKVIQIDSFLGALLSVVILTVASLIGSAGHRKFILYSATANSAK